MALYNDPILDKIEQVINADDGGAIKSYFQGDPILIAKSELPCLILSKDTTEVGDESTATDYHRVAVVLTLVSDIRESLGDSPKQTHAGSSVLYDLMEGRNADFTLKATSIVDILRKNHNLNSHANIDLLTPMTIDYGFTTGKRGEKNMSWEANLSFNIYFTQLRD